ncbi:unnamed protein product, partial [Ilex paraguariensis]
MEIMPCSTTGLFEVKEKHGNFDVIFVRKSYGYGKWEAIGLIFSETMCHVPTYDMPSLGISSDKFGDENDKESSSNDVFLVSPRSKKLLGCPQR